jgi:shikimate kinase
MDKMSITFNTAAQIETIKKNLTKPVVLIGMMAVGKSSLGQRLAQELSLPFYDSDKIIEDRAGMKISEIFKTRGEAHFRALEEQVVPALLQKGPSVIATGGGAVTVAGVLSAIHENSISVWIESSIDDIVMRVGGDQSRPLLAVANKKEELEKRLLDRTPLYGQAAIKVRNDNQTPEQCYPEMINKLYEKLKPVML